MKRTRKWAFVEQEAKRLAALGLSQPEIAKRLGVHKATISRWMATGKLNRRTPVKPAGSGQTPAQWAATVRKDYSLDSSDEQLVTAGERALEMVHDAGLAPHVRLSAIGRFQAVVRQLALVARRADEMLKEVAPSPSPTLPDPPRRTGTDPRKLLMAVK